MSSFDRPQPPAYEWSERVVEGKKEKIIAPKVPALPAWEQTHVVGRPDVRSDAREKVTGEAQYTTDVQLERMLHAGFVRSPHPHARILSIDVEAARRVPGVVMVVTGRDTRGMHFEDFPVIALDEVRYAGQEVAAVAAVTPDALREGLAAVKVGYQPLPFAVEPGQALASGYPLTGHSARFTAGGHGEKADDKPALYERGDPAAALAHAPAVIEATYCSPVQCHAPLETHAAVAHWEGPELTVWESTQGVFGVRETLAETLKVPMNRIRVISRYMGGGFGSKTRAYQHAVVAAVIARQTRRPVRFVLSREDEFRSPFYRPASIQRVRIGASADGKLLGADLDAVNPVGAFKFMSNWGSCENIWAELYDIPALRTSGRAVFTNIQPPVAMRGPGNVQGAWALEQALDELARKLDMDPVDLRLRNLPERDPRDHKPYASHGLAEAMRKGSAAFGWDDARRRPRDAGPVRRGVGMACMIWDGAGGPPASAWVTISTDGSVRLLTGAADIGTGTRTVLAQIVAEELSLESPEVLVTNADTLETPYTLPSYGSITLASSGPAVRHAAVDARRQLLALAAFLQEATPEDLDLANGVVTHRGTGKRMEIGEIAKQLPSKMITGQGERGANPPLALKAFGAQFAEVSVDLATGVVRVLRFVSVHDSGRIVNPRLWRSQVLGGIAMGIGYGTTEERLIDPPTGKPVTPNLGEYLVSTLADFPHDVRVLDAGVPFSANDIGAKGVGEPPLIPTAPAVANAVFDATGVRMREAPLTPARVLEALKGEGR